jgi:hypothetical protein
LLQRLRKIVSALAQLVEKAGVLNGNDGLRTEVLHQLNLLCGERLDFLAVNSDDADDLVFPYHRHTKQRAHTRYLNRGYRQGTTFAIGDVVSHVRDVDRLAACRGAWHRSIRAGFKPRSAAPAVNVVGGQVAMHRGGAPSVSLAKPHGAVARFAEPSGIGEHGAKHWLKFAGRAGDDFEHLRRRGLLVERFTQLVEQARVLDGDDGLACKV